MKIYESYKKIAKSMLLEYAWDRKFGEPLPTLEDVMKEAEVDNEKMIKYKDKDGETKQMKAGSAKTMDKDHPAKQAWDKMADKGGEEEPKGKGLGKGDFERDFDDDEDPIGAPGDVPAGELPDRSKEDEPEGDSEHTSKIQSVSDGDEIETLLSMDSDFRDGYEAIEDENSGYKDEYGTDLTIDDLKFKIKMIAAGEEPEDYLGDFNDEDELVDAWKDSVGKAMVGEKEESIIINGKQYRPIKDSVEPKKHLLRETYERIGGK